MGEIWNKLKANDCRLLRLLIVGVSLLILVIIVLLSGRNVDNKDGQYSNRNIQFKEEEQIGKEYWSIDSETLKIGVSSKTLYKYIEKITGNSNCIVKTWEYESYDKLPQEVHYVLCYGNEDSGINQEEFDGLKLTLVNISNIDIEDLMYDVSVKTGAIVLEEDEEYDGLKYTMENREITNIDKLDKYDLADTMEKIYNILSVISTVNRRTFENNYVYYVNSLVE